MMNSHMQSKEWQQQEVAGVQIVCEPAVSEPISTNDAQANNAEKYVSEENQSEIPTENVTSPDIPRVTPSIASTEESESTVIDAGAK